jgi:hypothetical protein
MLCGDVCGPHAGAYRTLLCLLCLQLIYNRQSPLSIQYARTWSLCSYVMQEMQRSCRGMVVGLCASSLAIVCACLRPVGSLHAEVCCMDGQMLCICWRWHRFV